MKRMRRRKRREGGRRCAFQKKKYQPRPLKIALHENDMVVYR